QPVLPAVMMQEFDLHLRHIDAGRAFALAALAANAEIHGPVHVVGQQRIGAQLAGQSKPQRVGPAARHVLLLAGGTVAGTHDAGLGLAAGAIVVAHLDRTGDAAPLAPVQRRLQRLDRIAGLEAEQAAVIHLRRADDLAGVHHALGIETVLHLLAGAYDAAAIHRLVEFRTHDAVAMLAGVATLVFAHHGE